MFETLSSNGDHCMVKVDVLCRDLTTRRRNCRELG